MVYQEKGERNYHVFYQLLKSGDKELLARLGLVEMAAAPESVMYINQSGCITMEEVSEDLCFC